jgi:replicative DNA helicase
VFLDSSNPNASQLKSAALDAAQDPRFKVMICDSISNTFNAGDFSQVVEVNNTIQQIARSTKCAFIGTSQVSREMDKRPEGKKIPLLSDAYGGGVIENNADTVIVMYRHEYYTLQGLEKPNDNFPPNTGVAILRKTRGHGGMGKMIRLAYVGGAGFYPLARENE